MGRRLLISRAILIHVFRKETTVNTSRFVNAIALIVAMAVALAVFAFSQSIEFPTVDAAVEGSVMGREMGAPGYAIETSINRPPAEEWAHSPKWDACRTWWIGGKDATDGIMCGDAVPAPVIEASVPAPMCPVGTMPLFAWKGNLKAGDMTNAGGHVTNTEGAWKVGSKEGQLMASSKEGGLLVVKFPTDVYVDSALVYDNDPSSGETGLVVNELPMPTTPDHGWATQELGWLSSWVVIEGEDSAYINLCVYTLQ